MDTQAQAKSALVGIARMNISKYIELQRVVNTMLTDGRDLAPTSKKNKKKGNCGFCTINRLMTKMAIHQDTAGEAAKTYKMLFNGEEIDMDALTDEVAKQAGFLRKNPKNGNGIITKDNVIMPEDAPQNVKDVCDAITKALSKNGKMPDGMTFEVVNMSGDNFGIKAEDFESEIDFLQAVSKAREEFANKKPEDIIKDSVIKKVENEHFDENKHVSSEKLN